MAAPRVPGSRSHPPGLLPDAASSRLAAMPFYVLRSSLASNTHASLPPSLPPVVFRWPRTIMWLINLITTTVIERGTRQALCREVHVWARRCLAPSRLLPPPDLWVLPRVGPGVGLCTPSLYLQ